MRPANHDSNRFNNPVPYLFNTSNDNIIENINEIFTFLSSNIKIDSRFMDYLYYKDYTSLAYLILHMSKVSNKDYLKFKPIFIENGINFLDLRVMYDYLIQQ